MKIIFVLTIIGLAWTSFAFHSFKITHPFAIDTSFLNSPERLQKKVSLPGLTSFIQQNFRDQSQIADFFAKLRERLVVQRSEQLALLEQQRATCIEERAFRNQAIAEAAESAGKSLSQLNLCTSERAEAVNFANLADNSRKVYSGQLEQLIQARDVQHRLYQDRKDKSIAAANAIDKTLEFLAQLETETADLAIAPQLVQLTNSLLQTAIRNGHTHLVLPIYSALLEMHQTRNFNAETIQQVRELINQLKGRALTTIQELDDQEASDLADYNSQHATLTDLIKRLDNQYDKSREYALAMEACIAQETSINNLANDKVKRNEELLATSIKLCQTTEDEYTSAELGRTKELGLINALQRAFDRIAADYEKETAPDVGKLINLKLL